jgi:hypothetical protein
MCGLALDFAANTEAMARSVVYFSHVTSDVQDFFFKEINCVKYAFGPYRILSFLCV